MILITNRLEELEGQVATLDAVTKHQFDQTKSRLQSLETNKMDCEGSQM